MVFGETDPQHHRFWQSIEFTMFFLSTFLKSIWLHTQRELLTYGLPKETVTAIMMLYKNTKVKIRSPDKETNFFDIVASVLQGITLVHIYSYSAYTTYFDHQYIWWKKMVYTKKKQKQKIPSRNYNRCRLCRWHNTSCKYTYPSQISAA